MEFLLAKLGNPHHKLPKIIHVAGTNGKGSVLAFLQNICQAHGLCVHAYHSPHLCRFHERITLRGEFIGEEILSDYLQRCEIVNENQPITFFEITSCAAFLAFSEHNADILLLEVGLGGRLDATNVIPAPIATILTPISYDHQQYLGESLTEIAREKAGIIKRNVTVISAQQQLEAQEIIMEIAAQQQAHPIWGENVEFGYQLHQEDQQGGWHYYHQGELSPPLPAPALYGVHQYQNAACALSGIICLAQNELLTLDWQAVAQGLQATKWAGRLQRIDSLWQKLSQDQAIQGNVDAHLPSEVWLDGAHNPDGARVVTEFLQNRFRLSKPKIFTIIAMLNSKDSEQFLQIIADVIDAGVALTLPQQEAAISAEILATMAKKHGLSLDTKPNMAEAILAIREMAGANDYVILVTGSLYFAGYVLQYGYE